MVGEGLVDMRKYSEKSIFFVLILGVETLNTVPLYTVQKMRGLSAAYKIYYTKQIIQMLDIFNSLS